jgi:hypothetical protein
MRVSEGIVKLKAENGNPLHFMLITVSRGGGGKMTGMEYRKS